VKHSDTNDYRQTGSFPLRAFEVEYRQTTITTRDWSPQSVHDFTVWILRGSLQSRFHPFLGICVGSMSTVCGYMSRRLVLRYMISLVFQDQFNYWTGLYTAGNMNITEIVQDLDLLWRHGNDPKRAVMSFGFYDGLL